MERYVTATKTSLYKLAKDFSNVPMTSMKYSNFKKIHRSRDYYLESGKYSFYFFACAGQATLSIREEGESTKIIKIQFNEIEKRGMLKIVGE